MTDDAGQPVRPRFTGPGEPAAQRGSQSHQTPQGARSTAGVMPEQRVRHPGGKRLPATTATCHGCKEPSMTPSPRHRTRGRTRRHRTRRRVPAPDQPPVPELPHLRRQHHRPHTRPHRRPLRREHQPVAACHDGPGPAHRTGQGAYGRKRSRRPGHRPPAPDQPPARRFTHLRRDHHQRHAHRDRGPLHSDPAVGAGHTPGAATPR